MVNQHLRFDPEELHQPFPELDIKRLANQAPHAFSFTSGGTVNGTCAIGSFGARFNSRKIIRLMKISVGTEISRRLMKCKHEATGFFG